MPLKPCVVWLPCIVLLGVVVTSGVGLTGCASDELSGTLKDNQPPQVWLSLAPPEGSIGTYKVGISWGGWDPDGEIAYYEYAVADNESGVFDPADTTGAGIWHRVFRSDSTFIFSADIPADSSDIDLEDLKPVEFRRSHTFFIRAVDDRGLASRRPAYRSFTSKTLSPVVDILVPVHTGTGPALVRPVSSFQWKGEDYVTTLDETQEPDSVRWILVSTIDFDDDWGAALDYIRVNPHAPEWSGWADYDARQTWTTPELEYGGYVFAVQVMDEAGAVSPVYDEDRNVRRVLVSQRATGPLVVLFNEYFGTIITSSTEGPLHMVDFVAGVPMEMTFRADASNYGGIVAGYRFSWDADIDDVEWIPFIGGEIRIPPRTFSFDSHAFILEVMDNSEYATRIRIRFNLVSFPMARDLLIVDDWDEGDPGIGFAETNGALPSDAEHDDFWKFVLDGLEGFDPAVDMIDLVGASDMPIQVLADYKSVIWSATGLSGGADASLLATIIRFVDPTTPRPPGEPLPVNVITLYMAAGGHVMLCGERVMTNVIDPGRFAGRRPAFPLIFRYELGGDQDGNYEGSDVGARGTGEYSFAYGSACLDVLDAAWTDNPRGKNGRSPEQSCSVVGVRDYDTRTNGLRFTVPIGIGFPLLELRPEVAGPGKYYAEDRSGLNCDIYNPPYFRDVCTYFNDLEPPRDCFEPIYGHGCLDQTSVIYAVPVAYWTAVYEGRVPDAGGVAARSTIWGFHPVYFNPDQIKPAVEHVLFDEWRLPRKTP